MTVEMVIDQGPTLRRIVRSFYYAYNPTKNVHYYVIFSGRRVESQKTLAIFERPQDRIDIQCLVGGISLWPSGDPDHHKGEYKIETRAVVDKTEADGITNPQTLVIYYNPEKQTGRCQLPF